MALLVQKFGGTSVGTIERIEAVADKVISYRDEGHDMVVVVSAMSGETNRLVELAKQVDAQARGRELDVLLTTGEQVTIALLAMALEKRGYPARSYTGAQAKITTDSAHNKARIKSIDHVTWKTGASLSLPDSRVSMSSTTLPRSDVVVRIPPE
jgi:aspartate kinase